MLFIIDCKGYAKDESIVFQCVILGEVVASDSICWVYYNRQTISSKDALGWTRDFPLMNGHFMKAWLRKLFWFILRFFESGEEAYEYKPLNRKILIIVGLLFTVLALITIYVSIGKSGYGFLIPVIVFLGVGLVSIIVGLLGSDRAVARIWGTRRGNRK